MTPEPDRRAPHAATRLGVEIPAQMRAPSRAHAVLASAIWLAVALPFSYLASLYWTGSTFGFSQWRGWVFALAALACVLMAAVMPPRYRVAIVGTKVKAWARLS